MDLNNLKLEPDEVKNPETPEQYAAIQRLALAGFYYINQQLSTPGGQYVSGCNALLEFAKEALEAFTS